MTPIRRRFSFLAFIAFLGFSALLAFLGKTLFEVSYLVAFIAAVLGTLSVGLVALFFD